tara:strand:- start:136 stop:540 length:405 start_codon:yes stop_codon:yes gene_type:complete
MNIDYTVAALMFPAIALIMGVYNSRFHTLSALIRKLHDEYVFEKHIPPEWKKQLKNLSRRSVNLKYAIGLAAAGFLFDLLTVFTLYLGQIFLARLIFGLCCLFLIISITFYIVEIFVSTNALKLHLSDMKIDED